MPPKNRLIGFTGAVVLLVVATSSASAFDSTTSPHPSVPWQLPNARALGGVANCPTGQVVGWMGSGWGCTNTVANSSNSAYASNSTYATGAGSANYATGAGSSSYANSSGRSSGSDYADKAGYADSAGSCNNCGSSGGGGGGGSTPAACSAVTYDFASGSWSFGNNSFPYRVYVPGASSGASSLGVIYLGGSGLATCTYQCSDGAWLLQSGSPSCPAY